MISKFRAWDENGKRYEGSEVCLIGELVIKSSYSATRWVEEAQLFNLCQCTGLRDKKGVEIYEGDIVDWLGKKGVVSFELNNQQTMISSRNDEYITVLDYTTHFNMQVLGNIYENQKLLEVAE